MLFSVLLHVEDLVQALEASVTSGKENLESSIRYLIMFHALVLLTDIPKGEKNGCITGGMEISALVPIVLISYYPSQLGGGVIHGHIHILLSFVACPSSLSCNLEQSIKMKSTPSTLTFDRKDTCMHTVPILPL